MAPLNADESRRARLWRRTVLAIIAVAAMGLAVAALSGQASAQSWWPFGGDEEPRRPRPAAPRPDPQSVPAPIPQPPPVAAPGAPAGAAAGAGNWASKNPICLQLEQRLLQEGQKGNQSRDRLPQIETEIRTVDRAFNSGANQLDKQCYEYFLFTKSFRNTAQCKELVRQVDVSKRRLAELEAQRQDLIASGGRSYQDDIVRELARNNCGANYVDQARRRDGGIWQDEEALGQNTWTPQGGSGVATYKTVCVRLCDGYYFPVSFSTLPSHFPQDAEACTSRCAAPTSLYYHPNPGGAMEQAVALQSNEPYTKLKTAFRYRKEYVNGCSCKEAEFAPDGETAQKKADGSTATRAAGSPSASAQPVTTGSTAPAAPFDSDPAAAGWASEVQGPADSGAPADDASAPDAQ
ncbi:MAG: DUF2865 domain-containing protein [Hyphomicrobium sp.]